ncbi:hypothetical protein BV20DRAFT_372368 [Pilatotrama ljubarskyi]|nr:hypothetical protein BV20DRAFT_372368 [Pilatotrama ljubarskyi]
MTSCSLARLATNLRASRQRVHQAAAALRRSRWVLPGDSAGLIVAPGFSTRLAAGEANCAGTLLHLRGPLVLGRRDSLTVAPMTYHSLTRLVSYAEPSYVHR